MKQTIIERLIGLLIITLSSAVLANAGTRNQEIAQCTEAELVTWGDGQDRPTSASSLIFFLQAQRCTALVSRTSGNESSGTRIGRMV